MGIDWSSRSGSFNIVLTNFNLLSVNKCEIAWKHQRQAIENFKQLCQFDERERLQLSLGLIPNKVLSDLELNVIAE
jgi:hypothetical protein